MKFFKFFKSSFMKVSRLNLNQTNQSINQPITQYIINIVTNSAYYIMTCIHS